MRILVFGDSIAQGYWDTEGGWAQRLRKLYDTRQIQDLSNRDEPTVFNVGISGDTTQKLAIRIEAEVKARLWHDEPQPVVVAIGTNDSSTADGVPKVSPDEFRQNLLKIIDKVQPHATHLIFIENLPCDETKTTPCFWKDVYYTNDRIGAYNAIIREVCEQTGAAFIPIFEIFRSRLDTGEQLLADGLHPNDAGHALIAELLRPEIEKILAI